jgi:hypothetical protein
MVDRPPYFPAAENAGSRLVRSLPSQFAACRQSGTSTARASASGSSDDGAKAKALFSGFLEPNGATEFLVTEAMVLDDLEGGLFVTLEVAVMRTIAIPILVKPAKNVAPVCFATQLFKRLRDFL